MSAPRTLVRFVPLAALLLAACREDSVTSPSGEMLTVCHAAGATRSLLDIHASELAVHRSHGDYVAKLLVDGKSATVNDSIHFRRITDALASARAIRVARNETTTGSCRITIAVGPGLYQGSVKPSSDPAFERLPLVIDVPDVSLVGSLVMPVDAKGRALGSGTSAAAVTTLAANPGLVSIITGNALDKYAEPMIEVNGHPDGPRGDGATIEGFVMRSGNESPDVRVGGNAVWAMRAQRLVVRGNQMESGFSEPIELRASTGRVERNLLKGRGGSCAICLFGPGDYAVTANRQIGLAGRLAVLVFPITIAAVPPGVEPLVAPATGLVTAAVTNNEFRDHQEVPFGIGVRIAAIGPGAPDMVGTARVTVTDNDLSHNRFAISTEAGFPVANTTLRGNVELTLKDNDLSSSCQAGLLVALTNQSTAMGLAALPSARNSAFTVTLGGDIPWANVWYAHPAGAANSLVVDGQSVDNGSRQAYDGTRSCPVQ